ncbi:ABC-F family ATP-binding cassette domain-containing protein, partial [Escherichia coli]|uniref:ATP-binding cassette domain-containing protein n=1 Tax=Escherichia coli TaxID=562 RepID=UPI00128F29A5
RATESLVLGYCDQGLADLRDGDTPMRMLTRRFEVGDQRARGLLAGAGLSIEMQGRPIGRLSGGQKARLGMLVLRLTQPNFYLLDEPTNHLAIGTKEMLVEALSAFEGTMLFVSHDRHFLAALSNRVLELTPDGIHQYGGGYTEYVARTGQEAPGLRS